MTMVRPSGWRRVPYLQATALCLLTTLGALPLREWLNAANIVMIFLLAVFVTSVLLGRGPAVLAAFFSVALFDFFFVEPHLSFAVADTQYLVTFAVMLAVGLIASQLVARLAERTAEAQARESDTRALYDLARNLGAALDVDQVIGITGEFLRHRDIDITALIADGTGPDTPFHQYGDRHLAGLEQSFARSAYERQSVVEVGALAGMGVAVVFLPLKAPTRVRGVLAVAPRTGDSEAIRAYRPLLEAVASLVAMIVERLHYADAVQHSELEVAAERLRTSILAALSHDLRTPLTSLVGLADSLAHEQPPLPEGARETAGIIREQAQAMHHLLSNLLEMARLQSGAVTLRTAWQAFDEVVGSSTRLLAAVLAERRLDVEVQRDLPLVCFDAVLLERVMCNLLENAAKYSAPGAQVRVRVRTCDPWLDVSVCNDGPGFPPERIDKLFDLFVRGERESAVAGTGMGLAICKAIVLAHGGTIAAENLPGVACVRFRLPLGVPPVIEEEPPA
jgi:two-component system sensor histidine kinase KdpD